MRRPLYFSFVFVMAVSLLLSACTAPNASPTATGEQSSAAPGSIQINAGGATFPLPVYTQWTYAYQYVDPSVVINYQGTGSGAGKTGILDNTLDFAGSDSLLNADQYTQGKDLQMYPVLAGGVSVIYNIAWAKVS